MKMHKSHGAALWRFIINPPARRRCHFLWPIFLFILKIMQDIHIDIICIKVHICIVSYVTTKMIHGNARVYIRRKWPSEKYFASDVCTRVNLVTYLI